MRLEFQGVVDIFKGDAEKFYTGCTNIFQKHVFTNLPVTYSTLLCAEVANVILASLTMAGPGNSKAKIDSIHHVFTEKYINILQYLAGYCFRTVFQKIRRKPQWQSDKSQQCLAVLKAAKLDSVEGQPLIMSRDRGGLWAVSNKAIEIFKVCEKEFILSTSNSEHHIDIDKIVSKLVGNAQILSNFDDISKSADCIVEKEISKNLLKTLLVLYIKVCTHSYAKKKPI